MHRESIPLVMAWGGLDPTGGAGLAADCAALQSHGCHPCPVATALTVQDSGAVKQLEVVDAALVDSQARTVLADLPIAAFKLGVVGNAAVATTIAALCAEYPTIPLVFDPVLRGGGGGVLASSGLAAVLRQELLPLTTVLTPNHAELAQLVPELDNPAERAAALIAAGCGNVLLTGADEVADQQADGSPAEVVNTLYTGDGGVEQYRWERVPGVFHGTGCTMAAALAGLLAQGVTVSDAVLEAQAYSWQAICAGFRPGHGQGLPDRLFWARSEAE